LYFLACVYFYRYNIEVSGGLGPTVGVVWRIGLMGYNSHSDVVEQVTAAMADALKHCTAAKL
jgi:alanine-glyoxylate transaminase/serine-glyoxylate transaminase/serine-pyruvate transaminase